MRNWFKSNWLLSCVILAVLFLGTWEWLRPNMKDHTTTDTFQLEKSAIDETLETSNPEPSKKFVDVKGEVENPDIYQISGEERVKDMIVLAGGFTDHADTSGVNLAQKVFDEMVIIVPKQGETLNETSSSASSSSSLLRINQATKEEIETLPGIGAVKAEAIIQHREAYGFFQSINELESITGIGKKTVEKLEPYIRVP
ncbi:ComE operon protein 1 [Paraliobacillus sp. PM-2]|uniref:helix-hairpin-helix domain-containing protein n=1 Tax=Paraliobacillus sp. PM-2 TaxID=1462524 RepID=UPI00061BA30C|nr:helix-hairpin-helix domain-containing protein [Paraliobacillus sp. PM-2]CQR46908.1 ComE operon protein 1 [Paraliobacillus sp. PM-2]